MVRLKGAGHDYPRQISLLLTADSHAPFGPIEHWHAWIGDTTIADAMLDRIMQRNHRFVLTGDSLSQKPKVQKKEVDKDAS